MTNLPTTLKKVLDEHCPFDSTSARAIQRVIALHVGHTSRGGKIEATALREQCAAANLFDYVPEGYERNTFGANFSTNMKKDSDATKVCGKTGKTIPYREDGGLWSVTEDGWKLTTAGKAEAKRIFDKGEAPTKRRTSEPKASSTKTKTKAAKNTKASKTKASKTKPKKPAKKTKASKSTKTATKSSTKSKTPANRQRRKAAQRRKRREVTPAPATTEAATAAAPTPEPAAAASE